MQHCQRSETFVKEMPRIARDQKTVFVTPYSPRAKPRIAREGERYKKRSHVFPEGWKTLEKREAMLEKRKNVESHAWGDLKCDRVVMLGR